jgi:flagellar basal body rod protein FlgG
MDTISLSAASGMRARMESLEMLANNLANTETGGYKGDREFYSLYASAEATADPQTGDLTQLPVIESHWTDFAQGDLRQTSNPMDLAIQGEGLFAVDTPRGVRYTRNGSFRISPAGVLTTADGGTVRGKGGGKITLGPTGVVEVLADGAVRQAGQPLGQLDLVAFDKGGVNKEAGNYFAATPGAVARPAKGDILQGKVESSNVSAPEAAVRLVAIMRQFEMLQKAMTIGGDFNRAAIEQVAKVAA